MALRKRTVHALDLGAGYCEWIAREARRHPRRLYAVIEREPEVWKEIVQKGTLRGLDNVAQAGADAFRALKKIQKSGMCVKEMHIRAPDELRRKLGKVLKAALPVLHPGGKVVLTTEFKLDSREKQDVASAGYSHKFLGVLKRKQTRFEMGLGRTTKIFHYVFKPRVSK